MKGTLWGFLGYSRAAGWLGRKRGVQHALGLVSRLLAWWPRTRILGETSFELISEPINSPSRPSMNPNKLVIILLNISSPLRIITVAILNAAAKGNSSGESILNAFIVP